MKTKGLVFGALCLLAACGRAPGDDAASSAPAAGEDFEVIVVELASDRARLDEVHADCREKRSNATATLCSAAAEATRRRFRPTSDPYADDPVAPAPAPASNSGK